MNSLKRLSTIAGISYLAIFFTAIFSNFIAIENIVVPGDAGATYDNLLGNEGVFRLAILSFIITIILDVVIAWALWILLKPVNRNFSLFAAWFRLMHAIIFAVAIFNLVAIIRISFVENSVFTWSENHLASQVLLYFTSFNDTWLIGLIFFGIHLIALGYLIYKSRYVPKFIGILLYIAGIGYVLDSTAGLLLPAYDALANIFMIIVVVPGIVGELSLTIWLLAKGVKNETLEKLNIGPV